ncbi:DUF6286 domain-containing protein [Kribbella sp. NPDC055071]
MAVAEPAVADAGLVPVAETVAQGGDRGRLEIAQRAVERIAEISARNHSAVVRQSAVLGRGLPKARAVIAGRRVRIEVQVAGAWGHSLAEVADGVRARVAADVEQFTGLGVDRVDVDITGVEAGVARPVDRAVAADPVAGKGPAANPAATVIGLVAAVLVIGLGVVGFGEMLSVTGLLNGPAIPTEWFDRSVVLTPHSWMIAAGIGAVVIGLVLLAVTLKPRRRTHLAVGDPDTMIWIRAADAARLACDSARHVDSVTEVSAVAKRRKLRINVVTFGDSARVISETTAAVDDRLQLITPRLRTRISVRED